MFRFLLFFLVFPVRVFGTANVTPEGCFEVGGNGHPIQAWRRILSGAEHAFLSETRWELDAGVPPVRVSVSRDNEPPSLSVDAIEGGGVSVVLRLSPSVDDARNLPLIAASLLLRTYYAGSPPVPGAAVPRYPDWILHGMGFLIAGEGCSGTVLLCGGDRTPELEEFLRERTPAPDQPSLLRYYERRAAILVHAGLCDDGGRKAFREWVGSNNPSAPHWIPGSWVSGWDTKSLKRRWVLGMNASGNGEGPHAVVICSAEATLAMYQTLMDEFLGRDSSLTDLKAKPGGAVLTDQLAEKLGALSLKANPLVVPLIEETTKLINSSRRMAPSVIRREEARIRAFSSSIRRQSDGIADYLNWYEAARSDVRSGLFDAYLSSLPTHPQKGPLGRMVDAVESRGW